MSKLTIITINLNNCNGLQKTIESVVSQTFREYEYIIIDGGSTDGSLELIKKFGKNIKVWISEPDTGIYNAMNKGIEFSTSEYCLFLNSGDWLITKNILETIFSYNSNADIVYGNIITDKNVLQKFPKELTLGYFFEGYLGHAATIIKKKVLVTNGLYSEEYKIVSDWEFIIKAIYVNCATYFYINKIISGIESGGISDNSAFELDLLKERRYGFKKLFPLFFEDYMLLAENTSELKRMKSSFLIRLILSFQNKNFYKRVIYMLRKIFFFRR